jgi:hypothetical protein
LCRHPPEAPELSAQIGARLDALEAAHRRLAADFFNGHRRRVDAFINETWMPVFTRNLFDEPRVKANWEEVVASKDPNDWLGFIKAAAPKLQSEIQAKRLALV